MGEFITTDKLKEIVGPVPKEAREDVVNELIARGHEIEGLNSEFSPLAAIGNVPSSLLEFGKSIWTAVSRPDITLASIGSITRGAIRVAAGKITGEQQPEGRGGTLDDEEAFNNVVDFFSERYGSIDRLKETIERDPAGFLSDAATVLGGVGGITKLTGFQRAGNAIVKASRAIEPTTAIPQVTKGISRAVRNDIRRVNEAVGVNKVIRAASSKIMADAINATPLQRKNIAKTTRTFADPIQFMTKHNIGGSLEQMSLQLKSIASRSYGKVDELIESVQGSFKPRDAKVLLNEVKNNLTTEFEDIIRIEDVGEVRRPIRVEDVGEPGIAQIGSELAPARPSGFEASEVVEFSIPGEQRRVLRIPKENLSTDFIESLGEINDLIRKFDREGLNLTEIQRVKRIADEFLDVYKQNGEPKAPVRFKNLAKARRRTRAFIENEAKKVGINNIFEINQQQSLARELNNVIEDRMIAGRTKSPWIDRVSGIVLAAGIPGFSAAALGLGGFAGPLAFSAAGLASLEIFRLPRVKSYFATRMRLMADGDFAKLQEIAETGRVTPAGRKVLRKEWQRFQKIAPELRLGGIIQEEQQRTQQ